jgi:hypothetical protein
MAKALERYDSIDSMPLCKLHKSGNIVQADPKRNSKMITVIYTSSKIPQIHTSPPSTTFIFIPPSSVNLFNPALTSFEGSLLQHVDDVVLIKLEEEPLVAVVVVVVPIDMHLYVIALTLNVSRLFRKLRGVDLAGNGLAV